jgi:hypothetical protein
VPIDIRVPRLLAALGMMMACIGASSSSCQFGGSDIIGDLGPSFVTDLTLRNAGGAISDTFTPGERIDMVLTVRNRRNIPATLQFPSARTSDFIVVREGSASIVWKWSADRTFEAVVTELEFAAGETKTITVSWDQTDNNGLPVAPGTYEARGVLIYDGFDADPLRSDPLGSTLERFTIR